MAVISWLKPLLSSVPHEELRHRKAFTAQELAAAEHMPGRQVAKVVVVIAGGLPVMLVLPAARHVVLDLVKDALGTKDVRLASELEMAAYFRDCEVGAEPPLRHWQGVELWMDESLRTNGDIVFPAGTHEDGIRMRFADWVQLARPFSASFTA